MPTTVDIPELGTVEFPDSMSEHDISAEVGKLTSQRAAPRLSRYAPEEPRGGYMTEVARGLTQFVPALTKTTSTVGDKLGNLVRRGVGLDPLPLELPEARPLYKAGQWMQDKLDAAYPAVPEPQRNLGHDVSTGLGQMASMVAGGLAARGAGATLKGAALVGTALGFGQEFDDAFTRARQRGDDPDTAFAKSLGYATVAALIENKLGAGRIIKKYFPDPAEAARKLSAWGISKAVGTSLAVGFGEEGSQRFAQNWIVEGKPSLEGVVQEGAPGGIVQAIAELPATLLRAQGGRVRRQPQTDDRGLSRFAPVTEEAAAPALDTQLILERLAKSAGGASVDDGKTFALSADYTWEGLARDLGTGTRTAALLADAGIVERTPEGNYRLNHDLFGDDIKSLRKRGFLPALAPPNVTEDTNVTDRESSSMEVPTGQPAESVPPDAAGTSGEIQKPAAVLAQAQPIEPEVARQKLWVNMQGREMDIPRDQWEQPASPHLKMVLGDDAPSWRDLNFQGVVSANPNPDGSYRVKLITRTAQTGLSENIGGTLGVASENLPPEAQAIEAANKAKLPELMTRKELGISDDRSANWKKGRRIVEAAISKKAPAINVDLVVGPLYDEKTGWISQLLTGAGYVLEGDFLVLRKAPSANAPQGPGAAAVPQADVSGEQTAVVKPVELMTPDEAQAANLSVSDHIAAVTRALNNKSPISAATIESFYDENESALSQGYVREGSQYVYKPETKSVPTVESPTPATPTPPTLSQQNVIGARATPGQVIDMRWENWIGQGVIEEVAANGDMLVRALDDGGRKGKFNRTGKLIKVPASVGRWLATLVEIDIPTPATPVAETSAEMKAVGSFVADTKDSTGTWMKEIVSVLSIGEPVKLSRPSSDGGWQVSFEAPSTLGKTGRQTRTRNFFKKADAVAWIAEVKRAKPAPAPASDVSPKQSAAPEQFQLLEVDRSKPVDAQIIQLRRMLINPTNVNNPARAEAIERRLNELEAAKLKASGVETVVVTQIPPDGRRYSAEATPAEAATAQREAVANPDKGTVEVATPRPKVLTAANVETTADVQGAQVRKPLGSGSAFSPKVAREQKKFLLDAVDQAIAEAPDTPESEVRKAFEASEEWRDIQTARKWAHDNPEPRLPVGTETYEGAGDDRRNKWTQDVIDWHKRMDAALADLVQKHAPVARLGDAINRIEDGATAAWYARLPHVTIVVPGDGDFTIINTKYALERFKERAKDFPTTAGGLKKPSNARTTATPAAKLGTPDRAGTLAALESVASSAEATRVVIHRRIWSDGEQSVATNGKMLTVVYVGLGGTKKKPSVFTTAGALVNPKDAGTYPDWRQVIPAETKEAITNLDTEALFTILRQSQEATSEKANSIKLWRNQDGSFGVSANAPEVAEYSHNVHDPDVSHVIMAIDPAYLVNAVNSARSVGDKAVTLKWTDELSPLVVESKTTTSVIMPMRLVGGATYASRAESAPTPEATPEANIAERATSEPAPNLGAGLAEGQGMSPDEARAAVAGEATGGFQVEFISKSDAERLTGKPETRGYGGFFWKGKIYLVHENMARGDLAGAKALLREEVGHGLLRTAEGSRLLREVLDAGRLQLTEAEKQALRDQGYGEANLLDEFIAKSARENLPWWKAAVEQVRVWLSKAGLANLTNEEVARLLLTNIRREIHGLAVDNLRSTMPELAASRSSDPDYDAAADYFDRHDREAINLIEQVRDAKPGTRVHWRKVPAARLKKIWLDFGKSGVVRDEKGMQDISDSLLSGIARLKAATELMSHERVSPEEIADGVGLEWTPKMDKRATDFFTDESGQWTLSDYGMKPLENLYGELFKAETAEQQLYAADKILNVVHQRSDLAGLFVEGGSKTLAEIANQGGTLPELAPGQPTGDARAREEEVRGSVIDPATGKWVEAAEGGNEEVQVNSITFEVRGVDRMSPEEKAVGVARAQDYFTQLGLPGAPDFSKGTQRGAIDTNAVFTIKADGQLHDDIGERILQHLTSEIQQLHQPTGSPGYVAALVNAITKNYSFGNLKGVFSKEMTDRLLPIPVQVRSFAGSFLRALTGIPLTMANVARNADWHLRRLYEDMFGGDLVRKLMDKIALNFRERFTGEEIERLYNENPILQELFLKVVSRLKMKPSLRDVIQEIFNTRIDRQDGIVEKFVNTMVNKFSATPSEAERLRAEFSRTFEASFRAAREKAQAKALAALTPEERKVVGAQTPLWRKLTDLVNSGWFDSTKAVEEYARSKGMKVPTEAELERMRNWSIKEQSLREPTAAELEKHGEAVARSNAEGATLESRQDLLRKMNTQWSRWTHPLASLRHPSSLLDPVRRYNSAMAANEWLTANLLLKLGFGSRQIIDVGTQMVLHTPTRAASYAFEQWGNDKSAGRDASLLDALSTSITDAYRTRLKVLGDTLASFTRTLTGRGEQKNVEQLISSIAVFDRALLKADEMKAQGRPAAARFLQLLALTMRFGRQFAAAADVIQGVPAEAQEMAHQIRNGLREQGKPKFQQDFEFNTILGLLTTARAESLSEARQILEARGLETSNSAVQRAAWHILREKIYSMAKNAGLPADEWKAQNHYYRNVIGWNEPETQGLGAIGGPGGAVALTAKIGKELFSRAGIPAFPFVFGNAMGVSLNRKLAYTPLGLFPGFFKGSPWFEGDRNIRQRKIEAVVGTTTGSILFTLAALGIWVVLPRKWPDDEKEKAKWTANGWQPGMLIVPVSDTQEMKIGTRVGAMALLSPYLAAGGAFHDATVQQARKQEALNERAAKLGLTPEKLEGLDAGQWLNVVGSAAWASAAGGRTASGMLGSYTDFGSFSAKKSGASATSTLIPGLPGYQELSRMAGANINPKLASFWDLLVPLPTSDANRVNLLGDPMRNENDVERIFQILTGGTAPLPASSDQFKKNKAYTNLFASDFRPPAINPVRGYQFGNELRPMTEPELQRYTTARGKNFASELQSVDVTSLPPKEANAVAQGAFQRANVAALNEVGAVAPRASTSSTTPPVTTAIGATPRVSTGPRRVGGRSRIARPRFASLRGLGRPMRRRRSIVGRLGRVRRPRGLSMRGLRRPRMPRPRRARRRLPLV